MAKKYAILFRGRGRQTPFSWVQAKAYEKDQAMVSTVILEVHVMMMTEAEKYTILKMEDMTLKLTLL